MQLKASDTTVIKTVRTTIVVVIVTSLALIGWGFYLLTQDGPHHDTAFNGVFLIIMGLFLGWAVVARTRGNRRRRRGTLSQPLVSASDIK